MTNSVMPPKKKKQTLLEKARKVREEQIEALTGKGGTLTAAEMKLVDEVLKGDTAAEAMHVDSLEALEEVTVAGPVMAGFLNMEPTNYLNAVKLGRYPASISRGKYPLMRTFLKSSENLRSAANEAKAREQAADAAIKEAQASEKQLEIEIRRSNMVTRDEAKEEFAEFCGLVRAAVEGAKIPEEEKRKIYERIQENDGRK